MLSTFFSYKYLKNAPDSQVHHVSLCRTYGQSDHIGEHTASVWTSEWWNRPINQKMLHFQIKYYLKNTIFWDVMPDRPVEVTGLHGITRVQYCSLSPLWEPEMQNRSYCFWCRFSLRVMDTMTILVVCLLVMDTNSFFIMILIAKSV
jgi:hypothetical protein